MYNNILDEQLKTVLTSIDMLDVVKQFRSAMLAATASI